MRRVPVLVTSVGGNVGQGVVKALRAARRQFRVIGIDMEPLSAGFSFVDAWYVTPRAGAPGFVERLEEICRREGVAAVYVCSHAELVFFAAARAELEVALGATVFVNPPQVVAIGSNKWRTVEFLRRAGLPHPDSALIDDEAGVGGLVERCGFPLVVKPCVGAAARNVFTVNSLEQLAALRQLIPGLVVQRCLPGEEAEYTAGTVSGYDGRVRAAIVLRRELLQGTTYRAELVDDESLTRQVVRIVEALGAVGPCNVQFRLVDGVVCPFEINPRFSGTSGIRYLYGFNDPELVFALLCEGEEVGQPELRAGVVLRYWEAVHIPHATFADLRAARSVPASRVASPALSV